MGILCANGDDMTGKIFDIQRFSIHDGPGIRTTVFMKGCNLKCRWCHNPESQKRENQIMFYKNKCKGCGECAKLCDRVGTDLCISCGKCADVCVYGARELCGKEISCEELLNEIKKDEIFYRTSGGGVTFSGGEPMLQPEFLEKMLIVCGEAGIHTAIETAACVSSEIFKKLCALTDLVICDIKCIDEALHIKGTGVSNRQILENARYLMERGGDVLFRMPLVPGFNEEQVDAVAEFVQGNRLQLMPYHSIGVGKYHALDREYDEKEFNVPAAEFMESITQKYNNVFFEK